MQSVKRSPEMTEKIDQLQVDMNKLPQVDCPLKHIMTPGLYTRQIFMPAGSYVISKIHNLEHPYIISHGEVVVFTEDGGTATLIAPFTGITKANTRRVLYTVTDVIWTTFHASDLVPDNASELSEEEKLSLVDLLEDVIIKKHEIMEHVTDKEIAG